VFECATSSSKPSIHCWTQAVGGARQPVVLAQQGAVPESHHDDDESDDSEDEEDEVSGASLGVNGSRQQGAFGRCVLTAPLVLMCRRMPLMQVKIRRRVLQQVRCFRHSSRTHA